MRAAAYAQSERHRPGRWPNPIANLIGVPYQSNFDLGFDGPDNVDGWRYMMNVQPVFPLSIKNAVILSEHRMDLRLG